MFVATSAPIALDRTRGAFYKGMRLMAIDGVRFDMPDTPANVTPLLQMRVASHSPAP